MKKFFNPYIGSQYEKGICGKKVLVLGASFYCNHEDCCFFQDCTDEQNKDSSDYDSKCPQYAKNGLLLSDSPKYELEERYKAYQKFASEMTDILKLDTKEDFWDKVAFTNYVQFIIPHWNTEKRNCSERDNEALDEVVKEYQPDVIIVWGCVTNEFIKEQFCYDVNIQDETDGYICHSIKWGKEITILNTYHPSSSRFKDNGKLKHYVKSVFLSR